MSSVRVSNNWSALILFLCVASNGFFCGFCFPQSKVSFLSPQFPSPQQDCRSGRKSWHLRSSCQHRPRRIFLGTAASSSLKSSAEDNEEDTNNNNNNNQEDTNTPKLVVSNTSLERQYKVASTLLGSIGLALFVIPDKTHAVRLATKWGGAAGFGVASGVSYIVAKAANRHQLGQDSTKRLNVGLLGFSSMGLFSVPGEAAFHPQFGPAMGLMISMLAVRLFSCRVFFNGWKQGTLQSDNGEANYRNHSLWKELWIGTISTIRGLRTKHKRGNGYRNLMLLVLAGMVSSLLQGLNLMEHSRPLFDVSLQWSMVSRLFLVSTMIFCLKDASENDKLTSTTSIQLNMLIGGWASLVALGSGIGANGFTPRKASHMAMFAAPFMTNAMNGGKKQERKYRLTNNNRKRYN